MIWGKILLLFRFYCWFVTCFGNCSPTFKLIGVVLVCLLLYRKLIPSQYGNQVNRLGLSGLSICCTVETVALHKYTHTNMSVQVTKHVLAFTWIHSEPPLYFHLLKMAGSFIVRGSKHRLWPLLARGLVQERAAEQRINERQSETDRKREQNDCD